MGGTIQKVQRTCSKTKPAPQLDKTCVDDKDDEADTDTETTDFREICYQDCENDDSGKICNGSSLLGVRFVMILITFLLI